MNHLLPILIVLSLRAPSADNFRATDWQPTFVESKDVKPEQSTVALLTHCSRKFDPIGNTADGVQQVVRTMKAQRLPVYYLHDRYNSSNPPWMYLYDDFEPTAYVGSDIGHISMDLSEVTHVICLGGYFGQCERATLSDTVQQWTRGERKHDLRITQIVDGTFTVAQHVKWEDSYRQSVRNQMYEVLRKRHKDAVLTVADVLDKIEHADQLDEYLQRQLPYVSANVNIVLDVFGRQITLKRAAIARKKTEAKREVTAEDSAGKTEDADGDKGVAEEDEPAEPQAPTLTFAYRRSANFLEFDAPTIDEKAPLRWVRKSGSRIISSVSPSNSTSTIISSPTSSTIITSPPNSTIISSPSTSTIISSPTFPTGRIYSEGEVIRIIESTPGTTIVSPAPPRIISN